MNDIVRNNFYEFDKFIRDYKPRDDNILMGLASDGEVVEFSTWKGSPSPNLVIENGLPVLKTMVAHSMSRIGFTYLVITNRPDVWKCQNLITSYETVADGLILRFSNYIRNRNMNGVVLLVLDNLAEVLDDLEFESKQYLMEIVRDGQRFGVFTVAGGHSDWDDKFSVLLKYNGGGYWSFEGSENFVFQPLQCNI